MYTFFLAALMLLCFTLGLAGCIAEEQEERPPFTVAVGEPSKITVSSVPGLSLILEEKEYAGPDIKVRYVLQNETELIYWLMSMSIEVLQDGEWHHLVPRTDVAISVGGPGIGIGPNTDTEEPHFFTAGFYEYGDIVPAGTYRLVRGVSTDEEPSVTEYLAAEFDVIE